MKSCPVCEGQLTDSVSFNFHNITEIAFYKIIRVTKI